MYSPLIAVALKIMGFGDMWSYKRYILLTVELVGRKTLAFFSRSPKAEKAPYAQNILPGENRGKFSCTPVKRKSQISIFRKFPLTRLPPTLSSPPHPRDLSSEEGSHLGGLRLKVRIFNATNRMNSPMLTQHMTRMSFAHRS